MRTVRCFYKFGAHLVFSDALWLLERSESRSKIGQRRLDGYIRPRFLPGKCRYLDGNIVIFLAAHEKFPEKTRNQRVLAPYSRSPRPPLARGRDDKTRSAPRVISERFQRDNGGAIQHQPAGYHRDGMRQRLPGSAAIAWPDDRQQPGSPQPISGLRIPSQSGAFLRAFSTCSSASYSGFGRSIAHVAVATAIHSVAPLVPSLRRGFGFRRGSVQFDLRGARRQVLRKSHRDLVCAERSSA